MKAAKIMGSHSIACVEETLPGSAPGHVLIQVTAAGICGSDKHTWELGEFCEGWIIGHEYEGIVVDPGDREDLRAGDRVTSITMNPDMTCPYCTAGHQNLCSSNDTAPGVSSDTPGAIAEYFSARADLVRKLPVNLGEMEGALVEPAAVCLHAVRLANLQSSSRILIFGAGVIAAMVAEFCRYCGAAEIVVVNRTLKRAEHLKQLGVCDAAICAEDPDWIQRLSQEYCGAFDACFETTGNIAYINQALPLVKKGHDFLLLGLNFAQTPPVDFMSLIAREQRLVGSYYYTIPEFEEVIRILSAGDVQLGKYISRTLPLDEIHHVFDPAPDAPFKTLIRPKDPPIFTVNESTKIRESQEIL